jgi:hypothetical protein
MDGQRNDRLGRSSRVLEHWGEILRRIWCDTYTYSHSDANSDTNSYGDGNSKPEPDRDGHVYTNGGTEIYTNT